MEEIITRESALELDIQIKAYANAAWANLVESCKCLKKMRDTKGYIELGYESFGEYTEASLNIKERQAYTYISTLENQGERFLQSNANLGITKLSLLNSVPVAEREELVEKNDIAGMSVLEVEALIKENDGKAEQINLLQESLSEKNEEIEKLEAELTAEKSKPTEVAVEAPSKEVLEKIRQEEATKAIKELRAENKKKEKELLDKLNSEKEKALADQKAASDKLINEYKEKLAGKEEQIERAISKAEELKKKSVITVSPDAIKFTFYFDEIQENFNALISTLEKIKESNPDTAEKYRAALETYVEQLKEVFK